MSLNNKKMAKITVIILLLSIISPLLILPVQASETPAIQWNKIYDSGKTDEAYSVTTDSNNNVIVTGLSKINGNDTGYTIKYNPNGEKILDIISDHAYRCKTYDVTVDSQDNIIIVGYQYSNDGDFDYFIAKHSSNGDETWNKSFDDSDNDIAYSVAVDSNDNIIVTGESSGNYCTIKYDQDGNKLWNKTYDNSYTSCARSIAVDLYDNIIVTGYVHTTDSRHWHTIKYDSDGTELWNKTYENGDYNNANGVAVDSTNNIIVVGTVYINSNSNGYIIKYNENGEKIWDQGYNQGVCEYIADVAINSMNDIIVAGSCCNTNEKMNYALIKTDSDGNHGWSTFYDRDNRDDFGAGVAADSDNNLIITGYSKEGFFPYDYLTIKYNDTISPDKQKPIISNVQDHPDPQNPGGYVNISCMVTDNVKVNIVKVNITDPNGSSVNVTMYGEDYYYYNTTYTTLGVYNYYIWANDTSNNQNKSNTYSFTLKLNTPPYQPANPYPADGAINVNINADLNWTGGDPDPEDTVTYDVYFGTNSDPPKVVNNQSKTSYDPGSMNIYTKYYWQIIAYDDHNHIREGPIWNFTTGKPAVVWVDDDYDNSTFGWGYDHFDNIQDGVNAVIEKGTVYVGDGIYYENIFIDKKISLIGSGITSTTHLNVASGWAVTINSSDVNISKIIISGNNTAEGGIKTNENGAYNHIKINHTLIQNFTTHGIKIGNDAVYTKNHFLYNLYVRDIGNEDIVGYGIYFTHVNNSVIKNSVVNNCRMATVYLDSIHHSTISNNTLFNTMVGIAAEYCTQNDFTKNRVRNTTYAIVLWNQSHYNNINNNKIFNTTVVANESGVTGAGIWIMGGNHNKLDYNYVSNTTASGENAMAAGILIMSFDSDAEYNIISNNQIYNTSANVSGSGIFVGDANNNTLEDNTLSFNDIGIRLWLSSFNIVSNSTIIKNRLFGIHLYSSSDNLIFNNNFNNTNNAWDNGNNSWDTRKTPGINIIGGPYLGGNYWSDYTGEDTDDPPDGIGDTLLPHNSSGNIKYGGDLLPLTQISDETPPEIIDNTLSFGSTGDSFTFNATITDNILLSSVHVEYWYGNSASHNNLTMNNIAGDNWQITIIVNDTLETLNYTICAKDWANNWNNTGIKGVVVYDNDKPVIFDVQDTPDPQNPGGYVNISCMVTDNVEVNLVKVNITGPNGFVSINETMDEGSYYYNITYPVLGTYNYYIWTNDTSNNQNISDIYSFTIRTNDPPHKPTNPSPSDGETGVEINPILNVTVSDPDGDPMNVGFYNADDHSLIGLDTNVMDGNTATVVWSNLNYESTYSWYAVASDYNLENTSNTWSFTTKKPAGSSQTRTTTTKEDKDMPPVADASAGKPYTGFVDEQITFNGSLSYDPDRGQYITTWHWNFGDGTNATGEIVAHSYSKPGNYLVNLTVKNNQGDTGYNITAAYIVLPNRPPSNPELNGPKKGNKNTEYGYTAVSIDVDNDTIKYVFDWDDGTNTTSDFLSNGTIYNTNHSWLSFGIYTIKVYTVDENNATSGTARLRVMIDTKYVKGIGYLIDNDSDGTYEEFYSNETGNKTFVEKLDDGKYLINSDDDEDWDYVYDPETDILIEYVPEEKTEDNLKWFGLVLGIIIVILLLIALAAAIRKKEKSKSKSKRKSKSKKSKK